MTVRGSFAHGDWAVEVESITGVMLGDALHLRPVDPSPALPVAMRNATGLLVTAYLTVDQAQPAADLDDFLSGLPVESAAPAIRYELPRNSGPSLRARRPALVPHCLTERWGRPFPVCARAKGPVDLPTRSGRATIS
jgi:hypothetical protein